MTGKKLERLWSSIKQSRRDLQRARDKRVETVKEYVGYHFSDKGVSKRVPLNMLLLLVTIYTRNLAARAPKPLVTTDHSPLRGQAIKLELGTERRLRDIEFGDTIQRIVLDAMFGVGIAKIGLSRTDADQVEIDGFNHDLNKAFVDHISLDDWVHDTEATVVEAMRFCGSRHRLPLDYVKTSGQFENVEGLVPTGWRDRDDDGSERLRSIGRSGGNGHEGYEDEIETWDIWCPREGLIVTLADGAEDKPIKVVEWEGPDHGPYRLLRLIDVPDIIMPLPPALMLLDLHLALNKIYRKLINQAERQKTGYGVSAGSEDDGKRVVDFKDGEAFKLKDPKAVTQIALGGPEQRNLALGIHLFDKFGYLAGNLNSIGGLDASSPTLGQDRLIQASSSKLIQVMQERVYKFTRDIVRDVAWYMFYDPMLDMTLTHTVPTTGREITLRLTAEELSGEFLDHNFDIEVGSMSQATPSEQMAELAQIWQTFIAPAAGAVQVDYDELKQTLARLSGVRDLRRILGMPDDLANPIEGKAPRGRSPETKTVNRVSRSAATRSGNDKVLMAAAMGSQSQPKEMANAFGGAG